MSDTACTFCGHPFDQSALGKYGCPNCHGEGLAVEAQAFGRGGIGSGVGDFRQAADNAARVTAKAEAILDQLASGETGLQVTVGPFDLFGLTVPAIPLSFRLDKPQ